MFHLNDNQEEMLIDFVFNLGTLKKFPKFTEAVFKKDWETAKKEYKRSYSDDKGTRHELIGRNTTFFNKFLKDLK